MPTRKTMDKQAEEQVLLLTDGACSEDEIIVHLPQAKINGRVKVKPRVSWSSSNRGRLKCYYLLRAGKRVLRFLPIVFVVCVPLYLLLYLSSKDLQNRHAGLPDWTYNTSRDIKDYVLPLNDKPPLLPRDFCREKTFLIIAVCSGLANFVQRQTIRETWGNTTEFNYPTFYKLHAHLAGQYLTPLDARLKLYQNYLTGEGKTLKVAVRIVFFVGRGKYEAFLGNETQNRLQTESESYNDIIQENFIDTYNNLTLKSVLALKHISKQCAKSSAFFLKCDDDTFVNVPNLLHWLLGGTVPIYNDTLEYYDHITVRVQSSENRLNATKDVMRGHQFCSARPVSDVSSKWYMPSYMYAPEAYPKYLSGAGYLMSMDVVERLYETALNTTLVYLEDVYITALCAEKAHIKRQHHPLFSYTHSRHWCAFKGVITQHEVKDDSMMEAWQFVSNYSIKCPSPGRYFKQMRLRKRMNC